MPTRVSTLTSVAAAALAACGGKGPSSPTAPTGSTDPSACAGLMPGAPGPGVEYTRDMGSALLEQSCAVPITDGHGEWIGIGTQVDEELATYGFVSASAPAGSGTGALVDVPSSWYGGPVIAPQPDGYHAIRAANRSRTLSSPGAFQVYDARGNLLSDDGAAWAWTVEGLPGGGSVVVAQEGTGPTSVWRLVWMGAAGDRRAVVDMPGPNPLMVVSSTGNVLAFVADRARWFDRNGAPLTDWFAFGGDVRIWWGNDEVLSRSFALADGSVAIGLEAIHQLRFEPASTRTTPIPQWVRSRTGAATDAVRGSHANAIATAASTASGCKIDVEIRTPAGESCGTTTLELPGPCGWVAFGADRTLFMVRMDGQGTKAGKCSWHWWTGLLR